MTTRGNGKNIVIGKQQRYFPPIARSPLGALDSAHEPDDKDDAHAAAVAHVGDCSDEQAEELQAALDRRAGARARAARARDEEQPELPSREEAAARARDGHEHDFRPLAAGGPDRRAADSRMAQDRRTRAAAAKIDLAEIFPAQHPHAHHDA